MNFLRRLDALPIFDPGRWPKGDLLARLAGILGAAALLASRVLQLPAFPGVIRETTFVGTAFGRLDAWLAQFAFLPRGLVARTFDMEAWYRHLGYSPTAIRLAWAQRLVLWLIESGILVGYIAAFLTRHRAQAAAKGFMQVVYPIIIAGLPVLIPMTGYSVNQWKLADPMTHFLLLGGLSLLLLLGGALNLVGLFTLRRSFSLMSEARVLVRRGVYRHVRHPLYAGHFVAFLGDTMLHFHPLSVVIYVAFVAGQVLRARIEERKLASAFPEYEEYRRSTGMFFPRFRAKAAPAP